MKKNTWIVILVVIIIGAIPIVALRLFLDFNSIFKPFSSAKEMVTQMNEINSAATKYGNDNLEQIKNGNYVYKIEFFTENNGFSYINEPVLINKDQELGEKEYRGKRVTILELVDAGYYNWSKVNQCADCNEEDKKYYDNIVVSDYGKCIMNTCYVDIIYSDGKVYAEFDIAKCLDSYEKTDKEGYCYSFKN